MNVTSTLLFEIFQESSKLREDSDMISKYLYVCIYIEQFVCHPSYHHNDFLATHALEHMMYGYTLLALINQSMLKSSKVQKQGA